MPEPQASVTSPPAGKYLGFDFGQKRIGIATADSNVALATPLTAVANRNGTPDWEQIDALVEQWQPVALVIGIPLTLEGEKQEITHHALGFKRRLAARYSLPVYATDERFSSMEAAELLKKNRQMGQRRKITREDIDKIAAARLLQRWLDDQVQPL